MNHIELLSFKVLDAVFVSPGHRGRGYTAQLMERLLSEGKDLCLSHPGTIMSIGRVKATVAFISCQRSSVSQQLSSPLSFNVHAHRGDQVGLQKGHAQGTDLDAPGRSFVPLSGDSSILHVNTIWNWQLRNPAMTARTCGGLRRSWRGRGAST